MVRAQFEPGGKVQRIEANLDRPNAALKQIGALMVSESQQAFKAQKFGKDSWEARAPINVYGIIADFAEGRKKPPDRRFQPRPALRDTGRLAASIAFQIVSDDTVEVGTNLEYASVHQGGGRIESKKITPTVRKALWAWLKKQNRELKSQLGFLLNKKFENKSLVGEVQARPFIGVTDQTIKDVEEAIGVRIMEVR
jgi:phage gpG-like protein